MSHEYKSRMLRAIASEPRTMLFFTEGDSAYLVAARHVESYADQMAAEGLIERRDGLMHITPAGIALLNRPTTIAEPRTWCAASTKGQGDYKPPTWNIRPGADEHQQYRSRGTGT